MKIYHFEVMDKIHPILEWMECMMYTHFRIYIKHFPKCNLKIFSLGLWSYYDQSRLSSCHARNSFCKFIFKKSAKKSYKLFKKNNTFKYISRYAQTSHTNKKNSVQTDRIFLVHERCMHLNTTQPRIQPQRGNNN